MEDLEVQQDCEEQTNESNTCEELQETVNVDNKSALVFTKASAARNMKR